jgi:hypothetical protein
MSELRFSEHAEPHEIAYDADWKRRNGELLDRAKEIQDDKPIMAMALINRFDELEQQRLTWKLNILNRIVSESKREKGIDGSYSKEHSLGH